MGETGPENGTQQYIHKQHSFSPQPRSSHPWQLLGMILKPWYWGEELLLLLTNHPKLLVAFMSFRRRKPVVSGMTCRASSHLILESVSGLVERCKEGRRLGCLFNSLASLVCGHSYSGICLAKNPLFLASFDRQFICTSWTKCGPQVAT